MSVEALTAVLHHSKAKGTPKLVLLGIANHQGDGGAWPAVSTLARYANVTERNVQKALEQLVQLGEVAVHRQAGGNARMRDWERPNRYDVLVSCPAQCDRTTAHKVRYPQVDAPLPSMPAMSDSDPVSETTPPVGDDTPPGVGDDTRTVHVTQPVADSVADLTTRRDARARDAAEVIHQIRADLANVRGGQR